MTTTYTSQTPEAKHVRAVARELLGFTSLLDASEAELAALNAELANFRTLRVSA